MRLERTKNGIRNIIWGVSSRFISLFFPFLIRTVMIYSLGAEYLGLNSLFTSILTVLNLAELGFSSAVVFSMYKPIAENDVEKICALMAYYRKVYRIIGSVVALLGMCILPFVPKLIRGSYPNDVNIYFLYILFLANTVVSYFLFAYKVCILNAYQRVDIISRVEIIVRSICYLLQIVILVVWKNYYVYLLLNIAYAVAYNIVCAFVAQKKYPEYRCKGILDGDVRADMKKNIGGLMIGKVCMVSRNSFDSIFISAFLGLQTVAIYGNYYYIMNAIIGMLTICMTSISAGIGNSIATESVEKNYNDMNKITFVYSWIAGWCAVCMFCLYQPFMELWMGKNMLFPIIDVVLICLYFYALTMGDVRSKYSDAAGLYWESRNYVLAEAVTNILLNAILGKLFGVHGIIFATLLTILVINFGWGTKIVFKHYFKQYKYSKFIGKHFLYFGITILVAGFTYCITMLVPGNTIFSLIGKAVICIIVPNIMYFIIYRKNKNFAYVKHLLNSLIKKS